MVHATLAASGDASASGGGHFPPVACIGIIPLIPLSHAAPLQWALPHTTPNVTRQGGYIRAPVKGREQTPPEVPSLDRPLFSRARRSRKLRRSDPTNDVHHPHDLDTPCGGRERHAAPFGVLLWPLPVLASPPATPLGSRS